jgi:hypothetical protein
MLTEKNQLRFSTAKHQLAQTKQAPATSEPVCLLPIKDFLNYIAESQRWNKIAESATVDYFSFFPLAVKQFSR